MAEPTQLAVPPGAAVRATSSYTELARLVRESGLMSRRYAYYWGLFCAGALALAGLVVGDASGSATRGSS